MFFLGNKKNVELLVQNCANVTGRDGEEALLWGARKGKKLVFRTQHHQQPNQKNPSTFAHVFFINSLLGYWKLVETLIKKGVNINAVDDEKSSSLILAIENGKICSINLM